MELTPWKGYTAVADGPQKFKEFIAKLKINKKKEGKKPSVYKEKQLNYINKTNELITISVCLKVLANHLSTISLMCLYIQESLTVLLDGLSPI